MHEQQYFVGSWGLEYDMVFSPECEKDEPRPAVQSENGSYTIEHWQDRPDREGGEQRST
jgi:hypothetical protein